MAKSKQNKTKVNNTGTNTDTEEEIKRQIVEKAHKQHTAYIEKIKTPFEESYIPEKEEYIQILPPYESNVFNISLSGTESQEYIESVLDEIDELATRLIANSDQFVTILQNKPSLILNDIVIKHAILKLQKIIRADPFIGTGLKHTGALVIDAIEILERAGIMVFKPKSSPKKKNIKKNELYSWERNPLEFASLVNVVKQDFDSELSKIKEETGADYKTKAQKVKVIKEIYKRLYNKKLTVPERYLESYATRPKLIAVIFVSELRGVSSSSAIRLWKSSSIPSSLKNKSSQKNK